MSERAVMLTLLRRSDNADCTVPPWNTPTIAVLAAEIPVTERRLRRILAHLAAHGWLDYTPGAPGRRPAGKKRTGKGTFALLPRQPGRCLPPCEGIHPATTRNNAARRKRGFQNPQSTEVTGFGNPHLKGVSVNEFPQVSTSERPRDAVTREVERKDHPGGPVPWDEDDVKEWLSLTDD
jgi:hypothetical protein